MAAFDFASVARKAATHSGPADSSGVAPLTARSIDVAPRHLHPRLHAKTESTALHGKRDAATAGTRVTSDGPSLRIRRRTYSLHPMTSAQRVTSFEELLDMLRGMRGQMVEAGLFLPEDGGQFSLMTFSGVLRGVEFAEESSSPRWSSHGRRTATRNRSTPKQPCGRSNFITPSSRSPELSRTGSKESTRRWDTTSSSRSTPRGGSWI